MAITKNAKEWKNLHAALQQDDAAKVKEIVICRLDLSKTGKYYKACLAAVRAGASNSLEALLDAGGGFRFRSFWHDNSNKHYAGEMVTAALNSSNPAPLLSVIYAANQKEKEDNRVDEREFIKKDAPRDVIQGCLEKHPSYFKSFVRVAGLNPTESSTEKLKVILAYTVTAAPRSQSVINDALITVVEAGDVDKTKLLLEQKADPNSTAAQALLNAGKGGLKEHKEIVALLLPHVTPELCGDVLKRLQQRPEKIDDDIIAAIEAVALHLTPAQLPTAAPSQTLKDRFNRLSEDVLEEMKPPSGESKQRIRYDFGTRQQIFLKDGTPTLAVSFNSLDEGVIAVMQEKLDALANPEQPKSLRLKPAS